MASLNHDRLIKRMVALLGATGLAAVSALPVLAQVNTNNSTNNGVLNPNPGIFNEYPYNSGSSSDQSQRSVNCSAYVNGGIGGPIDNGSSADNSSMTGQSSYDTATIPQNRSSDSMNHSSNSDGMRVDGQFSARNPNASIPFRSNSPAGTSGGESNLNLQAYRANNGSFMQSAVPSDNLTSSAYSAPNQANYSNQSVAPIPVECLPGGVNNR
jgi:hypothetical protein